MKKILLISHELSLTGAPRMLFNAALAIRQAGWEVVILSTQDGASKFVCKNHLVAA
ncbi:hypothetical protein [Kingella negevensis]|uniref:hypothetical protein n=1 Tax=Kingella negevensis TaxID=1522312 RepID=UPI0009DD78A7|nr:hypothetical protein [Kingella negevensis]MDK4689421.1 hypothetical protein [Kingella negevensis]WII90149.1 hypothetical protein QEO93_06590 [Kingella negevensis]WII94137.1 hypothetical protein QEO94_04960 [Kingella negevensis]